MPHAIRRGGGARAFYASTVVGRVFLFACFCALVATHTLPEPALLLLALVNLIGAIVMQAALRTTSSSRQM
jgi:hypothetical protein